MFKQKYVHRSLGFLAAVCFSSLSLAAGKTIELQSTFVGDKEQPGVSYIMPWKPPEGPGKLYRPIDSISGNILDPLERDQLIHSVYYYDQMALEHKEQVNN